MASVKLTYNNPETGSSASTTFTGLYATRGWYDVDEIRFPLAIQHRYMSGSTDEQNAGAMVRVITLDFGVVTSFANRKAILYFCLDTARTIDLAIAAPANLAAAAASGGTLVDDEYFYRVTAVDDVGETVGATEDSATTSGTDNSVALTWDAVSGATSYRIYRGTVTGTYDGTHFLTEVTTNSYTDTGAVALTSTYQLPSLQTLTVALENFQELRNEWMQDYQEAKRFTLRVFDATARTELIP